MAYKIYWSNQDQPQSKDFTAVQLTEALKFSEELRLRQRNGEPISFISLVSENPDCTSKSGVDVTGADYDWKKRRI